MNRKSFQLAIIVPAALAFVLLFVTSCSEKRSNIRFSYYSAPPFDLSMQYMLYEELSPFELKYLTRSLQGPLKHPKIVINKALRRLYLFDGNELVKVYPINLGPNPLSDKLRQGDNSTPEGTFYICCKNPNSKYYLSMGISYPNIEDAERGLRQGLITKQQYEAIVDAIRNKRRPPWFTKLGGAICIHGGGIGYDWTQGCIALRNGDIRELFQLIPTGAPVIIRAGVIRDEPKFESRSSYLTKLKDDLANEPRPRYQDSSKRP